MCCMTPWAPSPPQKGRSAFAGAAGRSWGFVWSRADDRSFQANHPGSAVSGRDGAGTKAAGNLRLISPRALLHRRATPGASDQHHSTQACGTHQHPMPQIFIGIFGCAWSGTLLSLFTPRSHTQPWGSAAEQQKALSLAPAHPPGTLCLFLHLLPNTSQQHHLLWELHG